MTISEQFWWLTPFISFPEPNGFSCPLLQHAPTRSIAFALTKPVHFDRCTRQDRHRGHSSCRIRKRHGLTCHPIRRSRLSVALEIRRRKRSGRSPCVQRCVSVLLCVDSSLWCCCIPISALYQSTK